MMKTASAPLLLTAAMILATCGSSKESEVGGQQTYSFRSDPDSEFLRSDAWTGHGWVKHESIIYTDGRFRYSVTSQRTEKTETYETRLSDSEMSDLLGVITASGLMQHNHKRARVADRRKPIEGLPRKDRRYHPSDGGSVPETITIQLSEDNCPGRRSNAPITARITVNPGASSSHPDVSELQASAELSTTLSQHRDKVRQPRTLDAQ